MLDMSLTSAPNSGTIEEIVTNSLPGAGSFLSRRIQQPVGVPFSLCLHVSGVDCRLESQV